MNTVAISGNLTRDPEFRTTERGVDLCNIGIAVQENRRNPDQSWRQIVHFFNAVAFNGQARTARKFAKGDLVAIQGKLQHRTFERADGSKGSVVEIVVEDFVGEKMYFDAQGNPPVRGGQRPAGAEAAAPAAAPPPSAAPPAAAPVMPDVAPDILDDDIPF